MIIAGTVANAVKLQTLNIKWQTKKESGDVLSKEERNERANWTQDDWLKHDFQEQLEQNKEASKNTDIRNKIMYGNTLTPEEEKYLEQNDPAMLQKYKQVRIEKKAYEKKLKSCKTKDEVQRLKTQTLGEYAAALKKVENDPVIPLSEKLAKAQETLAKTRSIQKVELKFMKTSEYANLPTEAEQAQERSEETELENERAFAEIKESVENVESDETADDEVQDTQTDSGQLDIKQTENAQIDTDKTEHTTESGKDITESEDDKIIKEIENAYQCIQLNAQLDEAGKSKSKSVSKDENGRQINVTV